MAVGAAILVAWSVVAWGCDLELLDLTSRDLAASKNPDVGLRRLSGSLAESCSFPAAVGSALGTVPSVEISGRPKLEQKAVTGAAAAWSSACPGGMATFDAAFAQKGPERAHTLYAGCDLGRYRFATEAELGDASGLVFLAVLVGGHFAEQKVPDAAALPLLRGLAGLSGPPPASGAPAAPSGAPATDPRSSARSRLALVTGKPATALPPAEWGTHATALLPLCEALRSRPAAERASDRPLEFEVCAEAGRAADNVGSQAQPLFRPVGGTTVNWGYYLAAALAKADPALLPSSKDETVKSRVGWYLQQVSSGALPAP